MKSTIRRILFYCTFVALLAVPAKESYSQVYDFKKFSVSEGMPHTQISTIFEDEKGFMWFGTLGGGLRALMGVIIPPSLVRMD